MSDPSSELKMWLAVREDIHMTLGKFGAQVGHAFGRLYVSASGTAAFAEYLACNEPKITVKAKDEAMLLRIEAEAKKVGIPCELIRDAGRSELEPGTATVCAFGPATREQIGPYLKRLQVLKDKSPQPSPSATSTGIDDSTTTSSITQTEVPPSS